MYYSFDVNAAARYGVEVSGAAGAHPLLVREK